MTVRQVLTQIGRALGRKPKELCETPPAQATAILIGPNYDFITGHTSAWLRGISIAKGGFHYALIGDSASKLELLDVLEKTRDLARVKVFFGHGSSYALLGPPAGDHLDVVVNDTRHGVVYSQEMIGPTRSSLFAFCCKSGKELGRRFCSYPGRTFLGYADDLPLNVLNEECVNAWKQILQPICFAILGDGRVEGKHEEDLRALYHEAFRYFHDGDGARNDQRLLMMMYVLRHEKLICWHEGG